MPTLTAAQYIAFRVSAALSESREWMKDADYADARGLMMTGDRCRTVAARLSAQADRWNAALTCCLCCCEVACVCCDDGEGA
jgi:hypothetical protein